MVADATMKLEERVGQRKQDGVPRRDFLYLTTAATAAVGTAAALWPFIASMNPAADVLASGAPLDFDLSKLEAGQQKIVSWRSIPIFVLRRTPHMLETLRGKHLISELRDPDSQHHQQGTYADNWHRSIKPEYAVLVGICTHLGCIPELRARPGSLGVDWPGGFFCPCHGSKYDLAGRVYKGVPAPLNLPVPPYEFVKDTVIRVGENPPGSHFALNDVEQM